MQKNKNNIIKNIPHNLYVATLFVNDVLINNLYELKLKFINFCYNITTVFSINNMTLS